jgi:hypothetical protein
MAIPTPTPASRLQRRFIVMSGDETIVARLSDALPTGWEMVATRDLATLGGFHDVLQYRFILLDLDDDETFDPLDVIRQVRMELMLNIAIICFGGAPDVRDEARLARADRFFERAEIIDKMKLFCGQYGWGGE